MTRLSFDDLTNQQEKEIERIVDVDEYGVEGLFDDCVIEVFSTVESLVGWLFDSDNDSVHEKLQRLMLSSYKELGVKVTNESDPLIFSQGYNIHQLQDGSVLFIY